jgi:hypothetical protein
MLIVSRERDAEQRRAAAARRVAELLIDIAATRRQVAADDEALAAAVRDLHADVRRHEQDCVDALLDLYGFERNDVLSAQLPLLDGRWENDLFSTETLRVMGVSVGKGAAAGAAAGVGIDLLAGGLTLGAAAALGAIIGGTWQSVSEFGDRLMGKLTGERELTVDDAILRVLAARQQALLHALGGRGHAAVGPIDLAATPIQQWTEGALPDPVDKARAHPEWSRLGPAKLDDSSDRQTAVRLLAQRFQHTD